MGSVKKVSKIILTNSKKQILLYLRDYKEGIPYKGYWDLIGGLSEVGESALETIKRECREELPNCKIRCIKELKTIYLPRRNVEITYFNGEVDSPIEKILLNEGKKLKYFELKELPYIKLPSHHKNFIIEGQEELEA